MAKPNYSFEKRQRELAKKKKKEQKEKDKAGRKLGPAGEGEAAAHERAEPAQAPADPAMGPHRRLSLGEPGAVARRFAAAEAARPRKRAGSTASSRSASTGNGAPVIIAPAPGRRAPPRRCHASPAREHEQARRARHEARLVEARR